VCAHRRERALPDTGGSFFAPSVVADLAPDNVLLRKEVSGSVRSFPCRSWAPSRRPLVSPAPPYGLAAGLWTADLGTAHRVSRALRAGTVWVNCYKGGDMNVPFGGVKLSGFWHDKSRHTLEYTDLKTTWIRYA